MARSDRKIQAGSLHHVFNRGIARRTMFETRRDRRMFMALVATAVKRKHIRVLAFCVMSTHYHLLVESLDGHLDRVMQRIQGGYSRYFNRARRRDGPLVRGRYTSKLVDSTSYLNAAVQYIELNPVEAGLTRTPNDYEFSSAFSPGGRSRVWVHRSCAPLDESLMGDPEALAELAEIMRLRLECPEDEEPVDELLRATPEGVLQWMRRKALLADGTAVGQPVCHWRNVELAVETRIADIRRLPPEPRMARRTIERSMRIGLLRHFAGLRLRDLSDRIGISTASVRRALRLHANFIRTRDDYAKLAAELASAAIRDGVLGGAAERGEC